MPRFSIPLCWNVYELLTPKIRACILQELQEATVDCLLLAFSTSVLQSDNYGCINAIWTFQELVLQPIQLLVYN